MQFKSIVFFNNFHNGDIHNSRGFVNSLINSIDPSKTYQYFHSRSLNLLKDIKNINCSNLILNTMESLVIVNDDTLCINTHIGSSLKGLRFSETGCNAASNMKMLNAVYKELGIEKIETDEWNLVASIDYSFFDINSIDSFFMNNIKKSVLICNGDVLSGQSKNFSFDNIILELSKNYPDINFITTKPISHTSTNIFSTDEIIKKVGDSDLNEISYLSTKCFLVVGRASGPFMFAQTKETLDDPNKTFLSFNDGRHDSFFSEMGRSKKVWSKHYNEKNVVNLINECII